MSAADGTGIYRRGAVVEATVLDATIVLLVERGAAIAVEKVAEASGVQKTTIYRRLSTRELLIVAAIRRLGEAAVAPVVDADPRAALEQLALLVAAALRSPRGGNILRAVMAASSASLGLIPLADEFFRERYALAAEHFDRLAVAGGMRSDIDPVVVWEKIVNPMHARALCGRATSD